MKPTWLVAAAVVMATVNNWQGGTRVSGRKGKGNYGWHPSGYKIDANYTPTSLYSPCSGFTVISELPTLPDTFAMPHAYFQTHVHLVLFGESPLLLLPLHLFSCPTQFGYMPIRPQNSPCGHLCAITPAHSTVSNAWLTVIFMLS